MAEIQIDQNLPAEEKTQKIERIAWIILTIFLALAFLGLFGTGPISQRSQNSNDNRLIVQSQIFERYESPTSILLTISGDATASTTEIGIENKYLDSLKITDIRPNPQFSRTEGDKTFYTFQTTEKQNAQIVINGQTQKIGYSEGEISVTNGPSLRVWQFIYP